MAKYKGPVVESNEVKVEQGLELGVDNTAAGMDQEECLQVIKKKYPKMVIARPYQSATRFASNGWQLLKIVKGGTDVAVAKTMDEADRTSETVLAWRALEVDQRVRAKDEKRRLENNMRLARQKDPRHLAQAFNETYNFQGVKATPLPEAEQE